MNNVCNDSIFVSIVVQYWCHSWHGISVVYDTVLMSLDNYDQNIPENQSNSMIKRLEMRLTRYVFSSVTPKRPQSLPPNSRKRSASLQLRFIQNHCAPDINIRIKSYKLPPRSNKRRYRKIQNFPVPFYFLFHHFGVGFHFPSHQWFQWISAREAFSMNILPACKE